MWGPPEACIRGLREVAEAGAALIQLTPFFDPAEPHFQLGGILFVLRHGPRSPGADAPLAVCCLCRATADWCVEEREQLALLLTRVVAGLSPSGRS